MAKVYHGCLAEWRDTVSEAEVRGHFTKEEKYNADHWDYCAVGNARELFPMLVVYTIGPSPVDNVLYYAGRVFGNAVEHDNFAEAHDQLDRIEQRLFELEAGDA